MPTSLKKLPGPSLFIVLVFLAAVALLGGGLFWSKKGSVPENTKPEVSTEDRYEAVRFGTIHPFFLLRPTADARNIDLLVANLTGISRIHMTFTYLSRGVEQGVVERIQVEKGATTSAKQVYLGSCSESTGIRRCYDHVGVSQGTVSAVLDKMQDERNQEIRAEFKLMDVKKEGGKLQSLDKNVEVQTDARSSLYVIAAPLTGLPKELPGKRILGQPYAFLPAKEGVITQATVRFTLPPGANGEGRMLYVWNADALRWEALRTTVTGSVLEAKTPRLSIFIAASDL